MDFGLRLQSQLINIAADWLTSEHGYSYYTKSYSVTTVLSVNKLETYRVFF